MKLLDIVHRTVPPIPWSEGEKIPWHDPAFSARMLHEHLSQAHDGASRRTALIADHLDWIHAHLLGGRPARILDLACGPGLYTAGLATLGHECVGIDFAPAAIAHAWTTAEAARLPCTYHVADIRTADYGDGFGLVMLISGEINVFRRADARTILQKAWRALADDGLLLLEAHTDAAVRGRGAAARVWQSAEHGLFSARPHLRLDESFWDDDQQVATRRYLVVDAETAETSWYAESVQAYTDQAYETLLHGCGFALRDVYRSLDGSADAGGFVVLVGAAIKQVSRPDDPH